jgi:hypothetical protein
MSAVLLPLVCEEYHLPFETKSFAVVAIYLVTFDIGQPSEFGCSVHFPGECVPFRTTEFVCRSKCD